MKCVGLLVYVPVAGFVPFQAVVLHTGEVGLGRGRKNHAATATPGRVRRFVTLRLCGSSRKKTRQLRFISDSRTTLGGGRKKTRPLRLAAGSAKSVQTPNARFANTLSFAIQAYGSAKISFS